MTEPNLHHWRLSEELSVIDAAILITGNDPSQTEPDFESYGNVTHVQKTDYDGFEAAFRALRNAILSNKLSASVAFPVVERGAELDELQAPPSFMAILKRGDKVFQGRLLNYYNHDSLVFLQAEPDWHQTTVGVDSIKSWLREKSFFPHFFFPSGDPDSFMNKDHSRYSAKLACAVDAWRSIKTESKNKTPKQTIETWVTANGVSYGLQNNDGTVPGATVEDISKVVNWKPQGGAARTGGQVSNSLEEEPTAGPDNIVSLDVVEDEQGKKSVISP